MGLSERIKDHAPIGARESVQTSMYDCLLHSILDALKNLEIGYEAAKDTETTGIIFDENKGGPDETDVFAAEVGCGLKSCNEDDMMAFITLSGSILQP